MPVTSTEMQEDAVKLSRLRRQACFRSLASVKPRFSKALKEENHEQEDGNCKRSRITLRNLNHMDKTAVQQCFLVSSLTFSILKDYSVGKHFQLHGAIVEKSWDLYKLTFHAKFPGTHLLS